MTTNMNFGPEWMRGTLPKHANGVSSDMMMPFEDQENPYKYSKDFMLSLYKPESQLPQDFHQHEYVTIDKIMTPMAFEELSESEKKLLSGPVHSDASSRKGNAQRHRNDLYSGSPMQSPANENGPSLNGNRLGQRKPRTGDYFGKDQQQQPLKRSESELLKRREQGEDMSLGKLDHDANWNNNKENLGVFNNGNGLFDHHDTFKSSSDTLFGNNSNHPDLGGLSNAKKPENTKWFYRDPSGQVQGPFEAQEMQDWYKAGFFTPTLMLCREDESIFEPLMVLTQKVGNEDTPFLAPRPRPSMISTPNDLFGTGAPKSLFRNDEYMPFGNNAPTTPGGSFLSNTPTTPLYQSPYYSNSLLRDNRWEQQPQASPSWLNPGASGDLFGSNPSSPFAQQTAPLNPVFGGGLNSPGLFDYNQRAVTDQLDQHQHYMNMLQQNQHQQRTMQFQQQQQQYQPTPPVQQTKPQEQPQQQEPSPQHAFKNLTLDNLTNINSNHASPVLRPNILTSSGWASPVPGTPVGEVPSSPWGAIVSSAIPNKVSEELQSKAPGAQSPRAPSSPTKKAIEKPVKTKQIIESFADIQLAEEKKAAAVAAATATVVKPTVVSPHKPEPKTVNVPTPTTKPVVSLREIQQEELRIANERKAKQAKASTPTTPSWAASNNTPLHTTTTTWTQPAHKPLSLREIQEMEAKEQQQKSAAEHLVQQEKLAHATPSTLSWGVVVPNTKAPVTPVVPTASSSAAWTAPSGPKKTLREIQQEEELAMKKKNAKSVKTTASTIAAAAAAASASKSRAYAVAPSASGAWTTVTSTRAPKPVTPTPVVPAAVPAPIRQVPITKSVPATKTRSGPSEEFRRWCRKALRDLNSGVNQEEIVTMLLSFPADANAAEIIEDVIYANSLRIDGKRFAQEFMKRRKADMAGRLDIVTAGLEEEDEDDFKVVIKKGKKKAI